MATMFQHERVRSLLGRREVAVIGDFGRRGH
jgi:hypothetical protein